MSTRITIRQLAERMDRLELVAAPIMHVRDELSALTLEMQKLAKRDRELDEGLREVGSRLAEAVNLQAVQFREALDVQATKFDAALQRQAEAGVEALVQLALRSVRHTVGTVVKTVFGTLVTVGVTWLCSQFLMAHE
jgi:predicted  nucleic acid-binding Zn-ribbon protein